ncbi:MAG: hypothetical protein WCQ54_00810 [Clostridiaceae bacterium]
MKHYIKNEIRRAIISTNAFVAFSITLGLLIIAFLEFIHFPTYGIKESKVLFDAVDIFIRIRSTTRASFLVLVAPLIAAIIFSDSYLIEKETGFSRFIYLRMSQKKYIWIKAIVNALVSGLVVGLASVIMLIFLLCSYGIRVTNAFEVKGPFSSIFYSNRLGYAFFVIFILSLFYMIFATLALGISPWIKNRYLSLILPFFYYIICGTIFDILPINRFFNLNATIIFNLNPVTNEQHIIIYSCLLLILGFSLFYFGVVRKSEKDL